MSGTTEEAGVEVGSSPRRSLAGALVRAMRPRQWTKNLLLFAGILFSVRFDELDAWAAAIAVFCAYCAASSAAYLVNDVHDVDYDRRHPLKRMRPVASGELTAPLALTVAGVLAGVAIGLAAVLNLPSVALVVGFLALQAAYTLVLKDVILLDVLTIAALFMIRAAAGAVAIDVLLSGWLIGCTGLLALFLGLAKRRGELALDVNGGPPHRSALRGYSLPLLDLLLAIVGAATFVTYAVYTLTAALSPAVALTLPFVGVGLGRYLFLVRRRKAGEEPERVLLSDRIVLVCVVAWVATAAAVLLSAS